MNNKSITLFAIIIYVIKCDFWIFILSLLSEGDEDTMKWCKRTINIALEIMGFVGMIIGDLCERRYLMYICGFMCFFFSACLYVDYVQRVKNELGIIKVVKPKKETNQYRYIGIHIFMAGCGFSALLCKLNINFGFLILIGALLGIMMQRIPSYNSKS